jgi:hypothetical protein
MNLHLSKFVHTPQGKIIMSVILGFGLATLFREVCKGKECVVVKAPHLEEIKDKIYKYNGKCYSYKAEGKTCDSSKQIIEA